MGEVSAYAIGRYFVTDGEYLAFLKPNGYPSFPSTWHLGCFPWWPANALVRGFAATYADAYVEWLLQIRKRHFQLPREVEWELATAGPEGHQYLWGQ